MMSGGTSQLSRFAARVAERIGESQVHDLGVLDAVTVARYAMTIGSTDPLHRDPDTARQAGYADLVAPVNLLAAIFEWGTGTPEDLLNADGTPGDDLVVEAGSQFRLMGGGEEMEILAPVVAGMRLERVSVLEDVVEKQTKGGSCVFVTSGITFREQGGPELNRNRRTIIVREQLEGRS